jgi:hypothetical protein
MLAELGPGAFGAVVHTVETRRPAGRLECAGTVLPGMSTIPPAA